MSVPESEPRIPAFTAAGQLARQLVEPLTGIQMNVETGLRIMNATTPDHDRLGSVLQRMLRDCGRAVDLVQQLRDILAATEVPPAKD